MADPTRGRQGFLGRLAQLPRERVAAEVARSLGFLFNTRKGVGSVVPSFGLGEYLDHGKHPNTQRAVETLRVEMLDAVRRYEPRIEDPAVRLLGGYHHEMVRFEIAGRIDGKRCVLEVDVNSTTQEVAVSVVEVISR
jgi:predicted component of type VI protein secretion system